MKNSKNSRRLRWRVKADCVVEADSPDDLIKAIRGALFDEASSKLHGDRVIDGFIGYAPIHQELEGPSPTQ